MKTKTEVRKITGFIKVGIHCSVCNKKVVLEVSSSDLDDYKKGNKLVQRCFPYLTPSQREMLISGYCESCWDELMKN